MEHLDILLIEDNIEDAIWVELQLRKASKNSYTLQTCDYFSKALELIKNQRFSLIILDLCLPDNKGITTLKNLVQASELPVIIYTGISDPLVREEAFNAGIYDFLVKGKTSAEELNTSIIKCIEKRKLASANPSDI